MSSLAFDAPLTLEIGPSRAGRAGLVVLHALAFAGLLMVPAPWALGGGAILLASAVVEWRRRGRTHRLRWCADGVWEHPDGAWRERMLDRSTFASGWLVVLALADGDRIHRYPLFRDALPADQWRRLRARLRVNRPAQVTMSPRTASSRIWHLLARNVLLLVAREPRNGSRERRSCATSPKRSS